MGFLIMSLATLASRSSLAILMYLNSVSRSKSLASCSPSVPLFLNVLMISKAPCTLPSESSRSIPILASILYPSIFSLLAMPVILSPVWFAQFERYASNLALPDFEKPSFSISVWTPLLSLSKLVPHSSGERFWWSFSCCCAAAARRLRPFSKSASSFASAIFVAKRMPSVAASPTPSAILPMPMASPAKALRL